MLGIIVTGHGDFSIGMSSALHLISGETSYFKTICFLEGASAEDLFEDLLQAVNELDACEKIVIFCDLAGGSPYKGALQCALMNEKVEVVAGVNFPTLLELVLSRENDEQQTELLNKAVSSGKEQLFIFDKSVLFQE